MSSISWFSSRVRVQLFDILNSMTVKAERKWKKPLSLPTVKHFDLLRESIEWIGRWSLISLTTGNEPFHSGL